MNKTLMILAFSGASLAGAQSVSVSVAAPRTVEFGISGGFYGGLAGELSVITRNLGGSAFGLRTSVGYANTDGFNDDAVIATDTTTGAPITAGQLFKQTLGYPNEASRNLTLGVDGLIHLGYDAASGVGANLYVGGRYNMFSTTISGDNGSVTWSSNQLGIGGGILASIPVAANVVLTGDLGVDRYFAAAIRQSNSNGDSQSFAPGTQEYNDTDRYINQPQTVFKAKVGLGIRY